MEYTIKLKNAPVSFSLPNSTDSFWFRPTLWNSRNKDARYYIDGALVKGIADILGNTNGDEISIGSIEP